MSQKDIWKKYITAQSKILAHKSKPIGVDTSIQARLQGQKLTLSIDQEIFKKVFQSEVERIFKVKDFDFSRGYILQGIEESENIAQLDLSKLKELAEICYIEFNENPIIEGSIEGNDRLIKEELRKIIGELPDNDQFQSKGEIHLTMEEWEQCQLIEKLSFKTSTDKPSARFNISPSPKFITEAIFNSQIFLDGDNGLVSREELSSEVSQCLNTYFDLETKEVRIYVKLDTIDRESALNKVRIKIKECTRFFPMISNDEIVIILERRKLKKVGHTTFKEAIREVENLLTQNYIESTYQISAKYYYSCKNFNWNYYASDKAIELKKKFEDNISQLDVNGGFRFDNSLRAIYFNFETKEELLGKQSLIKSIPFFSVYDRGNKHSYKFNVKFETGLPELRDILRVKCPEISTRITKNGQKLIFRQFYKTGNKTEILARLRNQLDEVVDSVKFKYIINDTFDEKYLCEENFDKKVEWEEEKLSNLLREDFYFGTPRDKLYLGKLQKVDYPDLYFVVDSERLEEVKLNINENEVKAIFPDLKGDRDKIKRLEDTGIKIDSKDKLPNDNAKVFLYDSSKAKKIENIEYLLNRASSEWKDFEKNLFSKSLNDSQKRAIFKSVHAEELSIIQGPPGTGKSTAIAEIIWQHVRQSQTEKRNTRILLTSETNLAVDNAIDRLKNGNNNVVKPIRFGNADNLESEGYFYSLEAIQKWKVGIEKQNNTVAHWVDNIVSRVLNQDDVKIDSALEKWKDHLLNPNGETRKLFADKYLEYANLIGATGSSIGKLNSENKWTSFFRSYLNVFNRDSYESRNFSELNKVSISFDTVIMDEASKATPPELALPVLFGKKSIVVGDHRQLPPMVDGEEIKDLLVSIGEQDVAKTLSGKDFQISQFERLFMQIDESIKGTFDTQYRMHPAINDVIAQFYKNDGGLNCGLPLEEIYHSSFDRWDSRYHGLNYKNIIAPEIHTIWINVTTPEIQEGTSRVNFGEIEAIGNILTVLKNCEGRREFDQWLSKQSVEEKEIGVISFYGSQIQQIGKMLKRKHSDVPIRLSTVDRFQGMERNIIIVSMVRSNIIAASEDQQPNLDFYGELGFPKQESLGFAESPNRLNVALSRARRLLIVVGNGKHFGKKDIYKKVYDSIQRNGKIIGAGDLHKSVEEYG
ncbi:DEAD/DEAH box helicase [Dyadobacter sediminis]|uniref:Uncharacterized protein n=1 Tax=Dyadobacter sediminis TaxID=1493691 RepID=A0A5R9KK33_9BACT|nr:AAA domain-containing protein [Dyadobacter sediminis]TLU96544.1 hypothetical protein FEM55_05275 [Dyadobacter sediminis]GGB83099.1 hypothetical protein GCM10011325_08310 [Dyadobacter sediminis]